MRSGAPKIDLNKLPESADASQEQLDYALHILTTVFGFSREEATSTVPSAAQAAAGDAAAASGPGVRSDLPPAKVTFVPPVPAEVAEAAAAVERSIPAWIPVDDAVVMLRCSRVALNHWVKMLARRNRSQDIEIVDKIVTRLGGHFVGRLQMRAERLPTKKEEWVFHAHLAARLGMDEAGLSAFMRAHKIVVEERDAEVARTQGGRITYDLAYTRDVARYVLNRHQYG